MINPFGQVIVRTTPGHVLDVGTVTHHACETVGRVGGKITEYLGTRQDPILGEVHLFLMITVTEDGDRG